MKFGICGSGRWVRTLGLQPFEKRHEVVGVDRNGSCDVGASVVEVLGGVPDALGRPQVALVYVPHGDPTDEVGAGLSGVFSGTAPSSMAATPSASWEVLNRGHGEASVVRSTAEGARTCR